MTETIFTKIVKKEIPADFVFESEDIVAFRDINPQAPIHILIIPRKQIETISDLQPEDSNMVGRMILTAKQIAENEGLAENGYRLVFNCKEDGGQDVYHIHLHLLGGRKMKWPPG